MQIKMYQLFNVFNKRGRLKQTLNHIPQFKESYEIYIYIVNQFLFGIYLMDDIICNRCEKKTLNEKTVKESSTLLGTQQKLSNCALQVLNLGFRWNIYLSL